MRSPGKTTIHDSVQRRKQRQKVVLMHQDEFEARQSECLKLYEDYEHKELLSIREDFAQVRWL